MTGKLTTWKRAGLAIALAATGLVSATSVEARDRYRHRGGDDAVIAIGAGLVGLAIGAAIADRDDRYYRDSSWYPQRRYVRVQGYPDYYYYYSNNPNRYYRDRYYDRYYRTWSYGRYNDRYGRNDRRYYRDRYPYGYRDSRYRDYRDYRYRDRDYYGYRRGY